MNVIFWKINEYKSSKFLSNASKRMREILTLQEKPATKSKKENSSSWWRLCTLISRSSLNMSRDIGYYWLRSVFYILVAVSAGSFFFNMGTNYQAIVVRGKCDGFIYGLMICLSIGGIPFVIEELKVEMKPHIQFLFTTMLMLLISMWIFRSSYLHKLHPQGFCVFAKIQLYITAKLPCRCLGMKDLVGIMGMLCLCSPTSCPRVLS